MKITVRKAEKEDIQSIHKMVEVLLSNLNSYFLVFILISIQELADYEGIAKDLQLTVDDLLRDGGFLGQPPLFFCIIAIDEDAGYQKNIFVN